MDNLIIVALISAGVSVLATIGNLIISLRAIKSSEKLIKVTASVELDKNKIIALEDYEKQTELFRMKCWNLKWWIEFSIIRPPEFSLEELQKYFDEVKAQARQWQESYAEITSYLPHDDGWYVSHIWSSCANSLEWMDSVNYQLRNMEKNHPDWMASGMDYENNRPLKLLKELPNEHINPLIQNLLELYSHSRSLRKSLLNEK